MRISNGDSHSNEKKTTIAIDNCSRIKPHYKMIILCFSAVIICYLDRTNIGVAVIPMSAEFGWSDTQVGYVLSAFFCGYIFTQIPAAFLSSWFGAKNVLTGGMCLWTICTILTPLTAHSYFLFLLVRFLMGLGEGVTFPCVTKLMASHVPKHERSRAVSIVFSGSTLGTVISYFAAPLIDYSWRLCFNFWAMFGLLWCLVSWSVDFKLSDIENKSHKLPVGVEMQEINKNSENMLQKRKIIDTENLPDGQHSSLENISILSNKQDSSRESVSKSSEKVHSQNTIRSSYYSQLFRESAAIAIFTAHFCHNWGWYILLSWLPQYLNSELGLALKNVGFYAVLPYIMQFCCSNISGFLADHLINQGWPIGQVRKLMQGLAFVIPSIILFLLICFVNSIGMAILCMTLAVGFTGFTTAGCHCNNIDISPTNAGTIFGVSNTIATIPGIIGNILTGYILASSGWNMVFMSNIFVYTIGIVTFYLYAKGNVVL